MLHPTRLTRARISFQPTAQLFATTGVLNQKEVAPIKCHFRFRCFEKKWKTTYDINFRELLSVEVSALINNKLPLICFLLLFS